jgi:hypothetical protein
VATTRRDSGSAGVRARATGAGSRSDSTGRDPGTSGQPGTSSQAGTGRKAASRDTGSREPRASRASGASGKPGGPAAKNGTAGASDQPATRRPAAKASPAARVGRPAKGGPSAKSGPPPQNGRSQNGQPGNIGQPGQGSPPGKNSRQGKASRPGKSVQAGETSTEEQAIQASNGSNVAQTGQADGSSHQDNNGHQGGSGHQDESSQQGGRRRSRKDRSRMPPVRLAPREELAGAARVVPLLRAADDLSQWATSGSGRIAGDPPALASVATAAVALDLTQGEVDAAWRVVLATGLLDGDAAPASRDGGDAAQVLDTWDCALEAILDADDLDGLATALYTVGSPITIDALFEAYTAAAGPRRPPRHAGPGTAANGPDPDSDQHGTRHGASLAQGVPAGQASELPWEDPRFVADSAHADEAAALSRALETLADLGVVELGTEELAGGLTVALSPLGVWGVHRRLRGQGWHVPVLGSPGRDGAVGLLKTLPSCDAEDGEAEISTWLAGRTPAQAARELINAAASGSPGLRGAAFAVLDRIGPEASAEVRAALADPLLRAHAAVWLHEHDEEAELRPADRTWLLVDLGAGLLEEADPQDVVAELLPEVPPQAQADIVAGLWQVEHPGVIDLLTALSDHHPDPGVARAARKAAFKARSPLAGGGRRGS